MTPFPWCGHALAPASYQRAWREGFAPGISDAGLIALRHALLTDDPRLITGQNTDPLPLQCHTDSLPRACCPVCFCGWQGDQLATVGEIEAFFACLCFDCDFRLGEPTACRRLLNWIDDTPRDEMRAGLLAEVVLALAERRVVLPFAA